MAFDHELKIRRAFKHLKDLDDQIKAWNSGNHYSLKKEYDLEADEYLTWTFGPMPSPNLQGSMLGSRVFIPPHTAEERPDQPDYARGIYTVFATAEQPPNDELSVLIGETLHNLRSGLDNLAFALAKAGKAPLPEEFAETSEFPIFGDEDRHGNTGVGYSKFNATTKTGLPASGSGLSKIRGWQPQAQTIVEGLQPYKRGNDFRSDPLWVLHELDRINKHRLLHTTMAHFEGTYWAPTEFRNVFSFGPGLIHWLRGPIETDTPIARFFGIQAVDPNFDVHVEVKPAIDIAFAPRSGTANGEPVMRTLWGIYMHVAGTVVPSLVPYL